MPTTQRKARLLPKEGKGKIVDYTHFTVQLLYATGETVQETEASVDLGAKYIGIAIQSQNTVIAKGEVQLRDDVKSNLTTKRIYRSSRRNRKTRYREPRFNNRVSSKKKG